MENARRRGRPRGSGKNDLPHLTKVADMLVATPRMKPTVAMRAVFRALRHRDATEATGLRRWQGKWKTDGDRLLQEARVRAADARKATRSSTSAGFSGLPAYEPFSLSPGTSAYEEMMRKQRQLQDMIESPHMRKMRDFVDSPTHRMMRDMVDSPLARFAQGIVDSPVERMMRDMVDSPMARIARGLDPFGRRTR